MARSAKKLHNLATTLAYGASPPAHLLVTGHFKADPDYEVYRPQGSPNWYAALTLRGHGRYRQSDVEYLAGPGDLVLVSPRAVHDYGVQPGGTWEFLWTHFNPRPAWLSWLRLPAVAPGLFAVTLRSPGTFDRARRAMLRLHGDVCMPQGLPRDFVRVAPEPGPYHEYLGELNALQLELALSGLEELLVLAMRESKRQDLPALDPRVRQVLAIIGDDPAAKHDLDELARRVLLSPSRLAHLFKQETGETIGYTLLMMRLRQASSLLEATSLPVGSIALELGYSSLYYFSRQFRIHFGISPRAYRAALAARRQL